MQVLHIYAILRYRSLPLKSGGAKPMSIGLWEGTRSLRGADGNVQRSAVYLSPDSELLHADSGEPVADALAVAISPEEVIDWSSPGAQVTSSWTGSPWEVDRALMQRALVWQQLAKAITRGNWRSDVSRPQLRFQPAKMPDSLPPGFVRHHDGALEMPLEFVQQNLWLEELALAEVAKMVRYTPGASLALSCTALGSKGGNVEFDLVATRGARILVVEAKTVSKSVGPDLSKKAAHASLLFGPKVRLLAFVPKVFGDSAPACQARRDIQANLGRNGHVCSSIADLGRQARAHLGI